MANTIKKIINGEVEYNLPGVSTGGANTLTDLEDTSIQTPGQGEVVMFDSTTNKWHNTPLTTLNEGEPTVDGEYVGQMYKNTTSGVMYIRNGEEWKEQGGDNAQIITISEINETELQKVLDVAKTGTSIIVDFFEDGISHNYYKLYKTTSSQLSLQKIGLASDNDVNDDLQTIYSYIKTLKDRIIINHNEYVYSSHFTQLQANYASQVIVKETDPAYPSTREGIGTIYVNSNTHKVYIWNGIAWKEIA